MKSATATLCLLAAVAACASAPPQPPEIAASLQISLPEYTRTPRGAYYQDLVVGTGKEARRNSEVHVRYTAQLASDGTLVDDTRTGEPVVLRLGEPGVIVGFNEAIPGMQVGGRRRLVVPADLAYGRRGAPPAIPPEAALVFTIELVEVS